MFEPVDAASLVFFRVAFGVIMLCEVWRYFSHGWIASQFIRPDFHFKYFGFEWIEPWPDVGMYWHFAVLGFLAFLIAIGAFYRIATVLFFIGFTYVFLLDQTYYLNHFYLVILFSFLLIFLPANKTVSFDSLIGRDSRARTVPAWTVWTIRLQFEVLYIYAGIVKINPDWLGLEPLGMWLGSRADFPVIGPLFAMDWIVACGAYGVILLHVVGAPLLLYRRTRPWVFGAYCIFHTMNHFLFQIGIFPWFTLAGTLIFFEPDWPKRLFRWLTRRGLATGSQEIELAEGS